MGEEAELHGEADEGGREDEGAGRPEAASKRRRLVNDLHEEG